MRDNCTTQPATGCIDCPEVAFVPGTPPRVVTTPDQGWNAGANSIAQIDNDVHTVFSLGASVGGAVIGLKDTRADVTVPQAVLHGLCFRSQAGTQYVNVIEAGRAVTAPMPRFAPDVFEIRRVAGVVTYFRNRRRIHTSAVPSQGIALVNACLYLSGDMVA